MTISNIVTFAKLSYYDSKIKAWVNSAISTAISAITNATTTVAGLMSAEDKTKLDGVATGAQVNVVESVSAAFGTADTPNATLDGDSKTVSVTVPNDLSKYDNTTSKFQSDSQVQATVNAAIAGLGTAINYKGSVEAVADLPTATAKAGDMWNVKATDMNYIFVAAAEGVEAYWDPAAPIITVEEVSNERIDSLFSTGE